MLAGYTQTINCSGNSVVDNGGAKVTAAYFGATINSSGNVSFSQSIADRTVYNAKKIEVDTDFEAFKLKVMSLYAD